MALAVVQVAHTTGGGGNATTVATFPGATTVGNLVVAVVNGYDGTPGPTHFTDSKSNTWTRDFITGGGGGVWIAVYSSKLTTAGAAHAMTMQVWNVGILVANIDMVEVSGQLATSPFDLSIANSGTSTAYTTGSTGTLSQADEIVLVSVNVDTGDDATITQAAGYTLVGEEEHGSTSDVANVAYRIVTATTAINHAWTTTMSSSFWRAGAVTYKGVASTPSFTGVIAATGPVAVSVLAGTRTLPTYTSTLAATTPTALATLVGVFIPAGTTRTGTLVATGPTAASVLAGTFIPPRIGVLAATAPSAVSALVGTYATALVINADDFNRANTSTPGGLGANWIDNVGNNGTARFHIVSNRATMLNLDNWATWKTAMATADHYVEADLDLAGTQGYCVIGCRRPSTSSQDGYQAFLHPDNFQVEIGRAVGGNYVTLARGGSHSGSGKVRLQVVGNVVTAYLNGTQAVTYTDTGSPLTTGTFVGLNGFSGNNDQIFWDNFAAAIVSAGPPPVVGPISTTSPTATSNLVGTYTAPLGPRTATLVAVGPTATSNLVGTVVAPAVSYRYAAAIAGRKIVDQTGAVYLMRTMSSWSMAFNLSNAEITQALTGLAGRGFNAATICFGGGMGGSLGAGWHRYTNKAGQNFWTGNPWQLATPSSPLGPAWSSVDWCMSEANRLGMTVNLSLFVSWGDTGAAADLAAATNTHLYNVGCAVATRYSTYSNIVWHVEFDDGTTSGTTVGQRVDAFFHGINDTEGATRRPVRWAEPNNGASIVGQLGGFVYFNLSMNGFYSYNSNSTEIVETSYTEPGATAIPTGDVEPPYDGKSGWSGLDLRYRSWATFLEGASYINYGHEDWWVFGLNNPFGSEGLTWQQVPNDTHTIQQQYAWFFLDMYVADPAWIPDAAWVTTGQGSGSTKAAIGRSNVALVAYFPNDRTIVVDTTQMPGTANVRLRWYDPLFGSFSSISASEAQTTSRSVTTPGNHGDGTTDWVLIVDVVDRTGVLVATGPPAISALRGTVTAPVIFTGTLVTTGPVATAALVGTFVPAAPGRTGVIAATGPTATTALVGTVTAPVRVGVIAATGPVAISALDGRFIPAGQVRIGVIAAIGPAASSTMVGTFAVPFAFGLLVALGPSAISNLRGTVINPIPLAGRWFLGSASVTGVRLGANTVSAVYIGTNPVWGSGI